MTADDSPVRVQILEGAGPEDRDDYLRSRAGSVAFQTRAWYAAVEEAYGHRTYLIEARRGRQLCGVLPLCLVRSRLFGRVLASSPFASSGSILADDGGTAAQLAEAAMTLARDLRVAYLELKSLTPTEGVPLQRQTDYLDYSLPLADPETLWAETLAGATRTCLRRVEREGVQCEVGGHLVEEFFRVMAINMKRLGTPIHSLTFYRSLVEHFGNDAQVIIARHEGLAIAGMLTLRHRDEVCVPYASSLASHRHLFPIDAVYWEALRRAWGAGATRFGFGRSLEGSGPAKYKMRWGALGVPLYYEYLLLQRSEIPRFHQGNARMELARSVWSRLPLRLTTLVGPRLIRSIV